MTELDLTALTVEPGDILVLTTKGRAVMSDMDRLRAQIPETLHGRVVIVDGTTLDAQVVRG